MTGWADGPAVYPYPWILPTKKWIGVGTTHWIAPPLPPNRTCGSPASGSPVGGVTSKRIDGPSHGPRPGKTTHAQRRRRVPFLHTVFQCRQHAVSLDHRFRPRPAGADLSVGSSSGATMSRPGHCAQLCFRLSDHPTSTFLRPFAPPALPGFPATMDALTPEWPALRRASTGAAAPAVHA